MQRVTPLHRHAPAKPRFELFYFLNKEQRATIYRPLPSRGTCYFSGIEYYKQYKDPDDNARVYVLNQMGYFDVLGSKRNKYRIFPLYSYNVIKLEPKGFFRSSKRIKYCAVPSSYDETNRWVSNLENQMLQQMLLIMADEKAFLKVANKIRDKEF